MRKLSFLAMTTFLTSCSLAPDFTVPDMHPPTSYQEEPTGETGTWKQAEPLEKDDRGQWWKIFGDPQLNDLEKDASEANQSLKAAAARVEEARATAEASVPSILPDFDIGANAVRSQPATASLAAFGQPGGNLKPYTLYNAQGVLSYEADLFGRVRNNYKALVLDADAQEAAYRSALLALQADVAQDYFTLRELDCERQLMRDTVAIRAEALRIMQHRFDVGSASEQDLTRTQSDLWPGPPAQQYAACAGGVAG